MRSKAIAIESIAVMIVLIIFAFVTFSVIGAGAGAYKSVVEQSGAQTAGRVAYSFISTKVKQNDRANSVSVLQTQFGDTLRVQTDMPGFVTYIFFSEDALYECLTRADDVPSVEAANKITQLRGFSLSGTDCAISIECVAGPAESPQVYRGTVGLRSK